MTERKISGTHTGATVLPDGRIEIDIRADLVEDECRMLSAQVAALDAKLAELSEWRPIETAPKDGTEILLLGVRGAREVGIWLPKGDSWADENGNACAAGYGTIQKIGCWLAGGGWFQPNEVRGWLPLPPPEVP